MLAKVKSTQLEEHCIATILRLNGSFLKKDLGPCLNAFGSYLDCKTKSVLRGFSPFSPCSKPFVCLLSLLTQKYMLFRSLEVILYNQIYAPHVFQSIPFSCSYQKTEKHTKSPVVTNSASKKMKWNSFNIS